MSSEANRIVQKLWSYCTVLRDDGLSYVDYLMQLSVLLFLKLAQELTQPPGIKTPPCLLLPAQSPQSRGKGVRVLRPKPHPRRLQRCSDVMCPSE